MLEVMLAFAGIVLAFAFRRRKSLRRKETKSPLAGYDTGVRSAWRTPGRFFRPHRGF